MMEELLELCDFCVLFRLGIRVVLFAKHHYKTPFVHKTLKLENKVSFWCWTDSMIVLSWIKGNPGKWKPFVANRVSDIQELTAPSCWYHFASEHNPADLSTGGKLAEDLIASDLWCKGPTWLSRPFDVVNTCRYDKVELSREEQTVMVAVAQDYNLIDY